MSHSAEARVGLEQTFFIVTEGVNVIEVCAVVFEPDIECPIKFPFNVELVTADGTAGKVTNISITVTLTGLCTTHLSYFLQLEIWIIDQLV